MARGKQWKPKDGERVKVVGMTGYDNTVGTVVGRTGAGLWRVQMDLDGVVLGADHWNVRQMNELEMLAAEAPVNSTPLGSALADMRREAQTSRGAVSNTWYEAAALLDEAMKRGGHT